MNLINSQKILVVSTLAAVVRKLSFLKIKSERLERFFGPLLANAGLYVSATEYTRFFFCILTLLLSFEALMILFNVPIMFLVLTAILFFFFPLVLPLMISSSKNSRLASEAPFFLVMVYLCSYRGKPALESAFEALKRIPVDLLPEFFNQSLILARNTVYSGISRIKELERTFSRIPYSQFRSFVLKYSSSITAGSDLTSFISSEVESFLFNLEERWHNFVSTSSSLIEVSFILMGVLPIGLEITFSSFSIPPDFYVISVTLIIALCTFMVVGLCDYSRPRVYDRHYSSTAFAVFILSFCALAASYMLRLVSFIVCCFLSLVLSLTYSFLSYRHFSKICKSEEEVTFLLHELSEKARAGKALLPSLQICLSNKTYQTIGRDISLFVVSLMSGIKPIDASKQVYNNSWFTRLAFALIGFSFEIGAGFEQLERIHSLYKRVLSAKKYVMSSVLPFAFLACVIPPLSFFSISFISNLRGLSISFFPTTLQLEPLLFSIFVVSLVSGIIVSKFYTGSLKEAFIVTPILVSTFVSYLLLL